MKQYKQQFRVTHFLFWICLFLMLSLLSYSILKLLEENSLLSSQIFMGDNNSMSAMTYDDITSTDSDMLLTDDNSNNSSRQENVDMNTSGQPIDEEYEMTYMGATAPIFMDGDIAPTGQFTNERGTAFAAGVLYYTGIYPQDFEQRNMGQEVIVTISLAFGWSDLPNFSEIELVLMRQQSDLMKIALSPISLLELRIEIENIDLNENMANEVKQAINEYVYSLFNNQDIPLPIISVSQQQLTSAYLQRGYNHVEFGSI